ncbi:MAG TPA: DedA family protein [Polyangiaceae bacterium]|nr:DedA family protein [Polyangiaceae bacterium]
MEQFIIEWGYWAVVLGCFLEGETVLVLAGLLAHKGYLNLGSVIVAACVGSVSGDQLWFLLGRYAGERWLNRMHRLKKMSERLTRWTTRHGTWFTFGFRFLYGIRTVAPAFLGLSRYPIAKFVVLNVLGAVVWSIVVAGLGWFIGATAERLLGRAAHVEEAALAVAAVAIVAWIWRRTRVEL